MTASLLHVTVPTESLDYDIAYGVGALETLPHLLRERGLDGRAIVCTDTTVSELHGARVVDLLESAGVPTMLWTMPAGESYKTLETLNGLYHWLAERRVERRDTLVALGGGVVGDLSGFAAATYLRGLRFVPIPTTIVAQVDSTVGGKVGVDLPAGKNLIGAFHQPALVVADPTLLLTLSEREWRAGLAEVIKSGIIGDPALAATLERDRARILARDVAVVAPVVGQTMAVKIRVVEEDPLERGLRRVLNYGHTLGHAIERTAGYGVVLHGEAVGWGMAAAARIGAACGTCDAAFVAWQDALLRDYGLLRALPPLDADALIAATGLDKKVVGGRVQWVLPRRVGEVIIRGDVPDEAVRTAAKWLAGQSER